MSKDYREIAGMLLTKAYNSKSTVESFAESLEAFEKELKREVAQQMLDEFKELDAECRKCDDGNEEMYNWCDFSCILMNQIASVVGKLGFGVNASDELVE